MSSFSYGRIDHNSKLRYPQNLTTFVHPIAFLITISGPDRLGIVSGLTELVVEKGGNVGESQASRLGSHFGLMMLVSVPKSATQDLQDAVKALEGMSTSCYPTKDPAANRDSPSVGCKLLLTMFCFFVFSYTLSSKPQSS